MTLRFTLFLTAFLLLSIHPSKASNLNFTQEEDLVVRPVKKHKANESSTLNAATWEELPYRILKSFLEETLEKDGTTIIRLSLINKNIRNFIEQTCETLDLRGNDLSTGLLKAVMNQPTLNLEAFIKLTTLNVTGCNLTIFPQLSIAHDPENFSIIGYYSPRT